MDKKEVITEMCVISTKVGQHLNEVLAHDCFCTDMGFRNFQFDEEIIDFIREAVADKINKEVKCTWRSC